MEKTAEVVIIGGGAVGLSTAYHLAKRGMKDIVLLEKDFLGEGSTGRCTGGVRLDFSTEVNVRFSLEAFPIIDRFEEEFGVDPEFRRVGYLMLASTEAQMEQFKANQEIYSRLGIRDVELLTPEEVAERWPYVKTDDILGATNCARDGFMGPAEVIEGYRRRARGPGCPYPPADPGDGNRHRIGTGPGRPYGKGRYLHKDRRQRRRPLRGGRRPDDRHRHSGDPAPPGRSSFPIRSPKLREWFPSSSISNGERPTGARATAFSSTVPGIRSPATIPQRTGREWCGLWSRPVSASP